MTKYYTVLDSMPGYLPDSDNPPIFTTRQEAREYMAEIAYSYRELDYRVRGNKRTNCMYVFDKGSTYARRFVEVVDITNQVRVCSECTDGCTHDGMKWCYVCDGTGIVLY